MTCIVAMTTKVGVYMGADSMISGRGGAKWNVLNQKMLQAGYLLVGVAGSTHFQTIMRAIAPDSWDTQKYTLEEYLSVVVLPSVRKMLDECDGWEFNEGAKIGPNLLIAASEELYEVTPWGGIEKSALPYYAIGSGREAAMGALEILCNHGPLSIYSTEFKIRLAIAAAITVRADCGGPIVVIGPVAKIERNNLIRVKGT